MNNAKKMILAGAALGMTALSHAQTTGTGTDYPGQLTENLSTINTIWGSVATIMIGVALVTVGVRFFRKAK